MPYLRLLLVAKDLWMLLNLLLNALETKEICSKQTRLKPGWHFTDFPVLVGRWGFLSKYLPLFDIMAWQAFDENKYLKTRYQG